MSRVAIHSSEQLIERATQIANEGRKARVVVACAQDGAVLNAISEAHAEGFIEAILVGDAEKIKQLAETEKADLTGLKLIDIPDLMKAADHAVSLAASGEAQVIMKGFLPTSALLKTALGKKHDLRGNNSLSHCAVLGVPGYDRLFNVTDGGMLVSPTLEQKAEILDNAVLVSRALGLSPVKVAVTVNTDELVKLVSAKYDDIEIFGPVTVDEATTLGCDIYLTNSIEEGNLISKSLIQFANTVFAGVIVGARVPISLVSRTDTVTNKKASLAIASILADYCTQNQIFNQEGK